jgi:hypothetical protein
VNGFRKPQANSIYHSFIASVEHRYRNGLAMQISFTGGKLLDDASQVVTFIGQAGSKQDFYCRKCEKSVSSQDVPSRLVSSFVYDLPIGKGRMLLGAMPKGLDMIVGGWQINGILSKRSGFPTDIRSSRIAAGNQMYATLNVPDRVPGVSMYLPNPSVDGYFNPAAFTDPQQVRNSRGNLITLFGNSARRVARGPGATNVDFSILKNFKPMEKLNVQIRAEAFNLTNTPTFTLPSASTPGLTIGNPAFGKLGSSSATGRQLQFGLKLSF